MHIKPKKGLGQHFLIDQNIQRKIISASELTPQDFVVEIGSGKGELTSLIAERQSKVYAIEIDSRFYWLLKDKFRDYHNVEIIKQDILKFNLKKYFRKLKQDYSKVNPVRNTELTNMKNKISNGVKVIGNIPYYITTPIIEHLFKFRNEIETIFITVQKEFAKRMVALPGSKDYGSFSCFVQYYTQAKIIFPIKKTCFYPPPKVDSCFLRLDIRRKSFLEAEDERLFFKIIRTAFQQRRKTLKNALLGIVLPEKLEIFFKEYDISARIRPENLTIEDFANLTKIVKKS